MANLETYYNIYANLSQNSYNGRKNKEGNYYNFSNGLNEKQKKQLKSGSSIEFHYPNAKDAHGNDASTVYLQPDNTVKQFKLKK